MISEQCRRTSSSVVHMAEHMDRLRDEALRLKATLKVHQRGYFTPTEDEEVSHLWISYHKVRLALLEVIDTIRKTVGSPTDKTVFEFAVAYASAVILIDAARVLRDLFSEDPIVRRKLNEAFPQHGITEGSFDVIQKSLTAPVNAVGLNRANQFYEEHAPLLAELANDDAEFQDLLGIIDRRFCRARVSKLQYVSARVVERRRDLRGRVIQGGLLRALYSLQEISSRLLSSMSTRPGHVPALPEAIAAELKHLIRAGDVFVTRKENAVTNYFLPGFWPHAAFYVGNERVVESLKDGVHERSLSSPMANDAVVLIRPLLAKSSIDRVVERARSHLGKPYDFDFDFTRADRMVCTEVVYRSLDGVDGISFQLTRRAGRDTLSAEDLLAMALQRKHFELVVGYCQQHHAQLCQGGQLESMLRSTIGAKSGITNEMETKR